MGEYLAFKRSPTKMCEEIRRKAYKRLRPEELAEAIRLRAEGVPISNLAQKFTISERQLHRILKQESTKLSQQMNPSEIEPQTHLQPTQRHIQSVIQEHHSAWIFEELLNDPHVTLESLAVGLQLYFGLEVSQSTIWRHIRCGGLESHGFPGYTKSTEDNQSQNQGIQMTD
ncbi:hypothetical protein TRFO_16656 [Tritrichomonas foetus]|uniref:Uncharacterized protein n=1 Tax=Tritrichomonas foetus TaxID=1144522 RepID=A0A1J4KPK4_9EUKA|nr:hypothetical protein TRFO_16656 [Tritrichomonas foetus]|eukprot:OHT13223.1 hypothetical protein TRFO_16656 [Tritrichomonas foetus]